MGMKWYTKLEVGWKRCPFVFQGHQSNFKVTRKKKSNLAFPDCNSSSNSPMATKWCKKLEVVYKRCRIVFPCRNYWCRSINKNYLRPVLVEGTLGTESKQILQPPDYLIIIVNKITYSNNRITKSKSRMPLDLFIKLGPYKFSLQASVDHHGYSMNSVPYTALINCCGKTFHCNDNKTTECNITDTYNSSIYCLYTFVQTHGMLGRHYVSEGRLSLLALLSVYSLTVEIGADWLHGAGSCLSLYNR